METVLVIDNGTSSVKAQLAGVDMPRVFPNLVGRLKYGTASIPTSLEGLIDGSLLVSSHAERYRGLIRISYPMEHAAVVHMEDMQRVWSHMYHSLSLTSDVHPVLMTEPPLTSVRQRGQLASSFFEKYHVPSLAFSPQPVLSLYSQGLTTGLVLDAGEGLMHASPVFEGFTVSSGIVRSEIGGRDITRYLNVLLRQSGHIFHTSAEFETVRKMKEEVCYVTIAIQKEEDLYLRQAEIGSNFTMPDGSVVALGTASFQAPELMFNPQLLGYEYLSIPDLVLQSIRMADLDVRRELYQNILVSGGSSMFRNFGDRLFSELKKKAPRDGKLRIVLPPERKFTVWKGASLLTHLTTFQQLLTTRKEWEEQGERALLGKAFR